MKYLKLFESFSELVNRLSHDDFVSWCNDHKVISVDRDDESKVYRMIYKNTDSRGFSTTDILPSDFERSKPEIKILTSIFPDIPKSKNVDLIFIKTYKTHIYLLKYDDDYWSCIYNSSRSNGEYLFYIIDGDDGLQKFFNEL